MKISFASKTFDKSDIFEIVFIKLLFSYYFKFCICLVKNGSKFMLFFKFNLEIMTLKLL